MISDVTNDVNFATQILRNATTRMYQTVDQLGLNGDISLKDAINTFGGWNASTPAQITAEYYKVGIHELSHTIFK